MTRRPAVPAAVALALLAAWVPAARAQLAFGLGGVQLDDGYAIAIDDADNIHVTGRFRLTADFDPGPGTFELTATSGFARYVAGYDPAGTLRYAFKIEGTGQVEESGIAVDASGNVYLTGSFGGLVDFDPGAGEAILSSADGSIYVAGYDASGGFLYAINFGVPLAILQSGIGIAVAPDGTSYVTGAFAGETDFDPTEGELLLESEGSSDIFVASFSNDGALRFAIGIGGTAADRGNGIAVDAAGNSYVTGGFRGSVDFDPGIEQELRVASGDEDVFVAGYTDDGEFRFASAAGGTQPDAGEAIAVDGAGRTFLTGRFADTADFDPTGAGGALLVSEGNGDAFVASYDAAGGLRFAFGLGDENEDRGLGLALDAQTRLHVTGSFRDTIDFDPGPGTATLSILGTGAFVASYTEDGDYRTAYAFSRIGNGTAVGRGIALDSVGRAHVIGEYSGSVDFDPGPGTVALTTNGSDDMFLSSYTVEPGLTGPGSIAPATLAVEKTATAGNVRLVWGPSCSTSSGVDYGIYEGSLGSWYDHAWATCTDAGDDLAQEIVPLPGDRYFLVVPLAAGAEGSYGRDGGGSERPVGTAVCRATQEAAACP